MSDKDISIHRQLSGIQKVEHKLLLKKQMLVEQALTTSMDPNDLIKANEVFNVDTRLNTNRKAYVIDPHDFQSYQGFKHRPYRLSYNILSRMSYSVPVIRAIINTRIDQIADFCEPQRDKYSTGFIIRKRRNFFHNVADADTPTKEEQQKIEKLTRFILDCGIENSFEGDDFDTFVRKIMNDSLTYDQLTFEVVHDRRGRPIQFFASDAATIRVADSYDTQAFQDLYPEDAARKDRSMGYLPSHVQILENAVSAEFYPWEMAFGVRNPTTNVHSNGYGVAEIEILTNTITAMLWSDEYNRRFFSHGSAPKGFFKIKPGTSISGDKIGQFKQQWQAMMAGVQNSHKTPMLEGDVDWVDLQNSNRDMEFSQWQEYLIKISSAIYRIDPAEINFPLSGGSEQKAMFEGNNEARLKHSKDKGLYPLIRFLERKINKYIIRRIDPEYELVFTGLGVQSAQEELESDIKMMSNFMTVDEIRIKRGMKPLGEEKGGNVVANSIIYQAIMAKQQAAMAEQQGGDPSMGGGGMGEDDGQDQGQDEEEQEHDYDHGGNIQTQDDTEENPFEKAISSYLKTLS